MNTPTQYMRNFIHEFSFSLPEFNRYAQTAETHFKTKLFPVQRNAFVAFYFTINGLFERIPIKINKQC